MREGLKDGLPRLRLKQVLELLRSHGYQLSSEQKVQAGIAVVLEEHGIAFEREVARGADRFDFLCDSGVVIEVKIAGSYSEALRQGARYCRHDDVTAVVLASTRRWSGLGRAATDPVFFHGKPVHTVQLRSRLF